MTDRSDVRAQAETAVEELCRMDLRDEAAAPVSEVSASAGYGLVAAVLDLADAVRAAAPVPLPLEPVTAAGCCRCADGEAGRQEYHDAWIAEVARISGLRTLLDAVPRDEETAPGPGHPAGCWMWHAGCLAGRVEIVLHADDPVAAAQGIARQVRGDVAAARTAAADPR